MKSKNTAIVIVVVLLVGGAAFYGGMQYQKSQAPAAGSRSGYMSRNVQGQGGQRMGGANAANGGFLSGQIISKDDSSITVKTKDGSSKIVYVSGSTAVDKSVSGTTSDLSTGQQVMITGKANTDGSIAAQTVQIRPAQPAQSAQPGQNQAPAQANPGQSQN